MFTSICTYVHSCIRAQPGRWCADCQSTEARVLGRDDGGGVTLAWGVGLWAWPEVWGEGAASEQDGASVSRWDARAQPGRWCADCQSTEARVRSTSLV